MFQYLLLPSLPLTLCSLAHRCYFITAGEWWNRESKEGGRRRLWESCKSCSCTFSAAPHSIVLQSFPGHGYCVPTNTSEPPMWISGVLISLLHCFPLMQYLASPLSPAWVHHSLCTDVSLTWGRWVVPQPWLQAPAPLCFHNQPLWIRVF